MTDRVKEREYMNVRMRIDRTRETQRERVIRGTVEREKKRESERERGRGISV